MEAKTIGWRVGSLSAIIVTALLAIGAGQAAAIPQVDEQAPDHAPAQKDGVPLTSDVLRLTVERLQSGAHPPAGVKVVDGEVLVEMILDQGARADTASKVSRLGGEVSGSARGLLEGFVPYDRLVQLERSEDVLFLRPPLRQNVPQEGHGSAKATARATAGEEVAKTNASAWHAAGITGAGVRIGIIDSFNGGTYNAAQAAGEVPAPAGTFCRNNGSACNVFGGVNHGVAVAEVIHEMAPGAELYLATARSTADHQAAVQFFAAQGVRIISRSLTAEYDGPGDGTGPLANVINSAVSQGITWFNSAGNSAGRGTAQGSYFRGPFQSTDGDAYLDFVPGDELMGFDCTFLNGLRWNDWGEGANSTDYDLEFYDAGVNLINSSTDNQQAGSPPIENANCGNTGSIVFLAVFLFDPGGGTSGDVLEFMTNGDAVEHHSNPFSASGPAADTANPGALAVGAVDPPFGVDIAPYSSEGPTNDGRIKPDLSAAACVFSFAFSPDCFNGTSSATPAAAGAAALVLQAGLATTPAEVKSYLMGQAVVDRGAAGADNVFGAGELVLPAPPASGGGGGGGEGAGPAPDACAAALDLLKKAKKQMKRARAKLRKAETPAEIRRAIVKIRKARKAIKRAKEAIEAAC